jgi:Domain of unknown function (DUF4328)
MADASLCRLHPDRPAIGACDRCGSFGCADCFELVGAQRLCPECRARSTSGLPPLAPRASLARAGLLGTGVAGFVLSGFEVAVGEDTSPDSPLVALFGLAGLGYLAIFIGTIVVFLRWFHLAARYSVARGVTLPATPGWAVGSWFVPVVNLFTPFRVTRAMLTGTGGNAGLVGAWQATWLVGNAVSNASSKSDNAALSFASSGIMLTAAFLGVKVIDELTRAASGPKT